MSILINWTPGQTLAILEKQAILSAFRFYRGNKTQTSQSLGISIRTLDSKLDEYKVSLDGEKGEEDARRNDRNEFLKRCRGESTPNYLVDGRTSKAFADQDRERSKHLNRSDAGPRVEPAKEPAAQQPVPMHERQKVQGVLPQQPAMGGAKGRR